MKPATQPVTHTPGPWRVEHPEDELAHMASHTCPELQRITGVSGACVVMSEPIKIWTVGRECIGARTYTTIAHVPIDEPANARLIAAAPELLRVAKDAADFLLRTARVLDEWAVQSQNGGWSTHQVEGNLRVANDCRREADCIQRVIDRATKAEGTQGEQR
jgi:hypothetical protein